MRSDPSSPRPAAPRCASGFSLVELLVAMTLGLVLVLGMSSVYLFAKGAFSRQSQVSNIQQSVRTAFEFLGNDARMIGHLGCFTGRGAPTNNLPATAIDTDYAVGVEGYEYDMGGAAYTITSNSPANVATAASWKANLAGTLIAGTFAIPVATVSNNTATGNNGLTPGSDVLVIRTVVGAPVRLTADVAAAGATLALENIAGGLCSDGSTAKMSGFCANSHGLVASCAAARVFKVNSIAGSALTLGIGGTQQFSKATSEVFPMQTIVYYVKRAGSGTSTSLYRRVFTGDPVAGVEQELIEDVESMQVLYGRDTTAPDPDGAVDDYKTADQVTDWSRVVTIRMSLLLRSSTTAAGDVALAASAPVGDAVLNFPGGAKYDRRVLTSTVAIRNKIAYFQAP